MVSIFRSAILVALASAAVLLFLPLAPTPVTLPLPQPGDPITGEQLATAVGLLAIPLGVLALLLGAVAAVGLFRFRAWARPMAAWTTVVVAGCLAASLWLSPVPIARSMTTAHAMLLVASALAWAVVLFLLRSTPIRNRFSGQ
jgi:hypothetical protein